MNENEREIGQKTAMKIDYKWLCGRCRKKCVRGLLPKIRRYVRDHGKVSIREVARFYGIPHSTLCDALNKKAKE